MNNTINGNKEEYFPVFHQTFPAPEYSFLTLLKRSITEIGQSALTPQMTSLLEKRASLQAKITDIEKEIILLSHESSRSPSAKTDIESPSSPEPLSTRELLAKDPSLQFLDNFNDDEKSLFDLCIAEPGKALAILTVHPKFIRRTSHQKYSESFINCTKELLTHLSEKDPTTYNKHLCTKIKDHLEAIKINMAQNNNSNWSRFMRTRAPGEYYKGDQRDSNILKEKICQLLP